MSPSVRVGSLAVLLAGSYASATSQRRLHQTATASLCAWSASTCTLNSDLVATLGPLGDLGASEADLRACLDPAAPNASCSGELPALPAEEPATGPEAVDATVPAEAPEEVDTALGADDIALTPLTIEPEAAAAPVAAGGIQPWDPANPPDYSTPAQCPWDGHTNPLTSGALPDKFEHKYDKEFEPFVPDDTPIADDTICTAGGAEATEHALGKVLVKDPDTGLCTACPEAKCTIWIPDPAGWYMPHCTGVAVLNDAGEFQLKFPMPGDEEEAGWGPDMNPHVHFECTGCGGTIWNKYYPTMLDSYCDTSKVANMIMSGPDESNVLNSVKLGSGDPGMFYIIMQEEWEMRNPNSPGAKCWAQKFGNPCPQYAQVGAACNDVDDPKPEPKIEAPEPVAAAEPVEVCVLGGGNLDYPGAAYPDADSLTVADAAACAKACVDADGCDASIYIERAAGPAELPNCYLKEDLVTDAGTALPEEAMTPAPRTVTLSQPCAGVQFVAAAAPGGGRRLAQAEEQCKELPVAGGAVVCVPSDATGTPPQLQTALDVVQGSAAFMAECPMAALSAGTATPECRQRWIAYFNLAGCTECVADVRAVTAAAAACGAAGSEQACAAASAAATQQATATGSDMAWQSVAAPAQPPPAAPAGGAAQSESGQEEAPATRTAAAATPATDGAAALRALPLLAAAAVLGAALL